MTDKEKLEKAVKLADAMYHAAQYLTTDASRLHKAMEDYHQFIIHDYRKEESASEDLEQAAEEYVTKEGYLAGLHYNSMVRSFKAGANWQREQMMKDAIECEVYQTEVEGIELDSVEICSDGLMLDKKKYKAGDKVKVIISKE